MRIAWFTPFIKESAIGSVSRDICEELSKSHTADIWTQHGENLIETTVNVVSFNKLPGKNELKRYDYLIYNIGNFAEYHGEIYDVLKERPGVVILHDRTLFDFWRQYCVSGKNKVHKTGLFDEFATLLCDNYGRLASKELTDSLGAYDLRSFNEEGLLKYPLLSPALTNARGVFTHARFFADSVKEHYNGPIAYSYLPRKADICTAAKDGVINKLILNARAEGRIVLVSTGIVHKIKQIDKVTEVLLENNGLIKRVCYIVIGSYGGKYGENLEKLSRGALKGCLHLLGYKDKEAMFEAISGADACINLRYPNTEVCSLSLLEQMSFAKPVLVLNGGIYGELPDDAVIKFDYSSLKTDLAETLRTLAHDKDIYNGLAAKAKEFVVNNCTAKAYCSALIDFLEDLPVRERIASLQNSLINSVSGELAENGIRHANTLESAATGIYKMFETLEGRAAVSGRGEEALRTIGVWAGFLYKVPGLNREGISRFIQYMTQAYVKQYNARIEVWVYSFNEDEIRIIFDGILTDNPGVIDIITEKNWMGVFNTKLDLTGKIGETDNIADTLAIAARECSKADIMIPMIIYLDNAVITGKKLFVPAHDLVVAEKYEDFVLSGGGGIINHVRRTLSAEPKTSPETAL